MLPLHETLTQPLFLLSVGLIALTTVGALTLTRPGAGRSRLSRAPVGLSGFHPPSVGLAGERRRQRFADVAGAEEAILELEDVRRYLLEPEPFRSLGAHLPRGLLLYGPPGTGKTLLARALAGETGVAFYHLSGSSFVEVFVGTGAARVRQLFEEAKREAPAIVFIDELDAVGRRRGVVAAGGAEEREATLNQLLVEMDGFDPATGVIVLGATNRPDVLDPALLRPGRFDRRIPLELPDIPGREAILRAHARGKPLHPEVDLDLLARGTAGFSGADLANLMNEAALLAARAGSRSISPAHLSEAMERVVAGPARRSRVLGYEERTRLAWHEAGHALVAAALPGTHAVGKVSIAVRGAVGGLTSLVSGQESALASRSQLIDRITGLLAGKAAEEIALGEPSTGASDDLARAAEIARRMVVELGMSVALSSLSIKPAAWVTVPPAHSDWLAATVDAEVQAILTHADSRARHLLEEHRGVLDELAAQLLEHESLEGAPLLRLLQRVGPVSQSHPAPR
jgi:cell division protease FtsH